MIISLDLFFQEGHEDGEKWLKLMVSKNFRQLVTMATRFWNFPKKIEEEYLLMSETCIEIIVFLKEIDSQFVQRYQPSEILPKIFSAERASYLDFLAQGMTGRKEFIALILSVADVLC